MQFGGGEVGIGRVVRVQLPDRRVAEQDAAAAVGLQAVFVRIDGERIDLIEAVESGAGFGCRGYPPA